LRRAVEGREIGIADDAEKLHAPPCGEPFEQLRIIAFGRVGVVPGGADHVQLGILRQRLDQPVNALVWRQPSDEEDAATNRAPVGREANGIGTAIDDPRA
jgi:hypothetical protein